MSKYYDPLVMVIEAPDYEYAACRTDCIISALCNLSLEDLNGFTEIDNLGPIEAPDDWFSQEYLHVAYDGEAFSLSLEAS